MRQRLSDQDTAFHTARKLHRSVVALVPKRELLENMLNLRFIAFEAKKPAREAHRVNHFGERLKRNFLRDQPNKLARLSIVRNDIIPANARLPSRWRDKAAKNRNKRGLARAIRAKQRKNFAFPNFKTDTLERLKPAVICFLQIVNLDNGHALSSSSRGDPIPGSRRVKPRKHLCRNLARTVG